MEKKYEDLIISLIQEHPRYEGLESVLEEIANDVYEHAKVVINSITNETVLISYLEKVISTSIITISRKKNLKSRKTRSLECLKQDIIENKIYAKSTNKEEESIKDENLTNSDDIFEKDIISEQSSLIDEKASLKDSEEQSFNTEDAIIETVEEDAIDTSDYEIVEDFNIEQQAIIEPAETLETEFIEEKIKPIILENTAIDNLETVEEESLCLTVEPSDINKDEEFLEEHKEFNSEYKISQDEHKTFIENMINGVPVTEEEEEFDSLTETLDIVTDTKEENTLENFEPTEELLEEENIQDLASLSEDSVELIDSLEPTENIDTLDTLERDIESLEIEDTIVLDIQNDSVETLELSSDTLNKKLVIPDFECFNFEPKIEPFDQDEIKSLLTELQEKNPEKQILKICELKYHQNLSIDDIAGTLALPEEIIIETLNEILEALKD